MSHCRQRRRLPAPVRCFMSAYSPGFTPEGRTRRYFYYALYAYMHTE